MNTFSEMIFKEYEKSLYKKSSDFMFGIYPIRLKIYDFHTCGLYIHLGNGNTLQFDVEVNFKWYRDKEYREDLVIPCSCELGKAISNFAAGQPMFKGNYVPPKILLSDYLIPDIRRSQFDEFGHEFLEKNDINSLLNKTPIFFEDVIEREGLTLVKNRRLTKDGSVMGMVVFEDGDIIDSRLGVSIMGAKAGTIYIDKRVCESPERERYTLMHELVHWFYHRQYFLFSKIAHAIDSKAIICMDEENQKIDECDEIYKLIESQANGIAARILMEKEAFISKYKELVPEAEVYYREDTGDIELKKLDYILRSIAKFFEVSVQSAKIRFMELGYMEFDGISNYLGSGEGRSIKIPDYTFSSGALKRGETYSIAWDDFIKAAYENKVVRELASQRKIVYADGHLVLNAPQYVEYSEKGKRLTKYAETHLDECAFVFSGFCKQTGIACSEVYSVGYRKTLGKGLGKAYLGYNQENLEKEIAAAALKDPRVLDRHEIHQVKKEMRDVGFYKALEIVMIRSDRLMYEADERTENASKPIRKATGGFYRVDGDGNIVPNYSRWGNYFDLSDKTVKLQLQNKTFRPTYPQLIMFCVKIGLELELVFDLLTEYDHDISVEPGLMDIQLELTLNDRYELVMENYDPKDKGKEKELYEFIEEIKEICDS